MPDMKLAPNASEVAQMSALRIKYDCGLGDNGRTIVKTRGSVRKMRNPYVKANLPAVSNGFRIFRYLKV